MSCEDIRTTDVAWCLRGDPRPQLAAGGRRARIFRPVCRFQRLVFARSFRPLFSLRLAARPAAMSGDLVRTEIAPPGMAVTDGYGKESILLPPQHDHFCASGERSHDIAVWRGAELRIRRRHAPATLAVSL